MFVLDASVVVELLLNQGRAPTIAAIVSAHPNALLAPHLLDAEVAQVLRRFVLRGELSAERARDALSDFVDLPIQRFPHTPLLPRAFELRSRLTVYDALYLALAEITDAEILTLDAGLSATAQRTVSARLMK